MEIAQPERALRILVVDDEQSILDFIQMGLTYEGYAVETAADGRSALEAARRERPDLVVLDVMLPEIDGLEVCRRLRDAKQRIYDCVNK